STDLLGLEADRSAFAGGRCHARRVPSVHLPANRPAADAARRGERHRLRVLDVCFDVRHPDPADRRPVPNALDPNRGIVPAHARRAIGLHDRGSSACNRRRHRAGEHMDLAPARRPLMTSLERLGSWLAWTTAVLCAIFLLTPLVVTIAVSFGSSAVFTLPPPGWSMRWYERLLVTRGLVESLGTSLQIAALSTAISLMLGTLCAIGLVRGRFHGRDAISTFL